MKLTPEIEAELRMAINQTYVDVRGTESWERNLLINEIDRLRADLDEQCRLLGMSEEREAKLLGEIEQLKKYCALIAYEYVQYHLDFDKADECYAEIMKG
jgi:hypothetical protein